MKQISINGVFFTTDSPSKYVCRDYPSVSIIYEAKNVRVKKGKKLCRAIERRWILNDGKCTEKFKTLTDACNRLYKVLKVVYADII